jgi:hypothetical protein
MLSGTLANKGRYLVWKRESNEITMTFAYCYSLYYFHKFLYLSKLEFGIHSVVHELFAVPSSKYYLPLGLLVNERVAAAVCRYLFLRWHV